MTGLSYFLRIVTKWYPAEYEHRKYFYRQSEAKLGKLKGSPLSK